MKKLFVISFLLVAIPLLAHADYRVRRAALGGYNVTDDNGETTYVRPSFGGGYTFHTSGRDNSYGHITPTFNGYNVQTYEMPQDAYQQPRINWGNRHPVQWGYEENQ